ncbi:MAG: hypothetical protein OEW15_02390 [Nitrospirota bacterium]|nr:hypothetical protein [Nitrospirota bacterium]
MTRDAYDVERKGYGEMQEQDLAKIRAIIEERNVRYAPKGGSVTLAGIEGGTVKIAPAGFCWR